MSAFNTLTTIINQVAGIVKLLIPLTFALGILAFFWGLVKYIFAQSNDGKTDGKKVMLWALVAIFVMTSVWGIVQLAQNTLGINTGSSVNIPQVNF